MARRMLLLLTLASPIGTLSFSASAHAQSHVTAPWESVPSSAAASNASQSTTAAPSPTPVQASSAPSTVTPSAPARSESARSRWTWGRPDGQLLLAGAIVEISNAALTVACIAGGAQCAWNALPGAGAFIAAGLANDHAERGLWIADGVTRIVMPALFVMAMLRMPDAAARASTARRNRGIPWVGVTPMALQRGAGVTLVGINF